VSDPAPGSPELVVGAWRGYRVWRIIGDGLTGWWCSDYLWAPGVSEASCSARRWTLRGRRARHPDLAAPQRDCACGLYALQEPWDFTGYLPSRHFGVSNPANAVIGVAAGWGRAFRGKHGWRAQFARPVALYWTPDLDERVDRVARRYRCQVVRGGSELLAVAKQRV
jgi:hypothetical protein